MALMCDKSSAVANISLQGPAAKYLVSLRPAVTIAGWLLRKQVHNKFCCKHAIAAEPRNKLAEHGSPHMHDQTALCDETGYSCCSAQQSGRTNNG